MISPLPRRLGCCQCRVQDVPCAGLHACSVLDCPGSPDVHPHPSSELVPLLTPAFPASLTHATPSPPSQGPWHLMKSMHSKYGEVFTVPLAHKRMTFLLGPHASPHFFNATDERMSQTEVYSFNVPTFGEGVVFDVDQRVRSEQFRFVADALRSSKLKTYVPAFRQEAEDFFAAWGDTGVVNLAEVFGELIILTASRTLMGREVRESMFKRVADLFHDLDDGMRPLSVLFPYLPTAYHRKRDAARAALSDIFKSIIAARRASGVSEDDVLQVQQAHGPGEGGSRCPCARGRRWSLEEGHGRHPGGLPGALIPHHAGLQTPTPGAGSQCPAMPACLHWPHSPAAGPHNDSQAGLIPPHANNPPLPLPSPIQRP